MPRRKPTAVLEATGAFRKNPQRRKGRGIEPAFTKGAECPSHLTGLARQTWEFLAAALDGINLMRRPHALALEAASVAYARAVEADLALARDGLTHEVKTKAGSSLRMRPEVSISARNWEQFRKFASEFGLTPAAMAKLAVEGERPKTLSEILDSPAGAVAIDLSKLL